MNILLILGILIIVWGSHWPIIFVGELLDTRETVVYAKGRVFKKIMISISLIVAGSVMVGLS